MGLHTERAKLVFPPGWEIRPGTSTGYGDIAFERFSEIRKNLIAEIQGIKTNLPKKGVRIVELQSGTGAGMQAMLEALDANKIPVKNATRIDCAEYYHTRCPKVPLTGIDLMELSMAIKREEHLPKDILIFRGRADLILCVNGVCGRSFIDFNSLGNFFGKKAFYSITIQTLRSSEFFLHTELVQQTDSL